MAKTLVIDELHERIAKFERVIVSYKCGCSFYNDSWKSSCESEHLCPEHNESIKAETREVVGGYRPQVCKTQPYTLKMNLNGN
jgi:hypothetical protein